MNKSTGFLLILLFILTLLNVYQYSQRTVIGNQYGVVSDTITYVDTVRYPLPVPYDSVVIRYITQKLPVTKQPDTNSTEIAEIKIENTIVDTDSVEVALPIIQNEYRGEDYHAWVSGYMASLDSVFVFPKTVTVTNNLKAKHNRWGVGIQIGIGAGNGKIYPYAGVGVSYNLFAW
jgi:hypothetical protein